MSLNNHLENERLNPRSYIYIFHSLPLKINIVISSNFNRISTRVHTWIHMDTNLKVQISPNPTLRYTSEAYTHLNLKLLKVYYTSNHSNTHKNIHSYAKLIYIFKNSSNQRKIQLLKNPINTSTSSSR